MCGWPPNRRDLYRGSEIRAYFELDADEEDQMDDEEFDILSSDEGAFLNLASARYAKDNPVKAVSQLCTAISKWTKDYLQ